MFPRVSAQSELYEFYRVESFQVKYKTRSPATQAGTVMLTVDYDESDESPATEMEAMNTSGAKGDGVWKDLSLTLDPKAGHALNPWLRVRHAPIGGENGDYDFGRFYVSTVGCTGSPEIGKLSIKFRIRFMKSVMPGEASKVKASRTRSYIGFPSKVLNSGVTTIVDPAGWVSSEENRILDGLKILDKWVGGTGVILPKGVYRVKHTSMLTSSLAQNVQHRTSILKNGAEVNGYPHTASSAPNVQTAAVPETSLTASANVIMNGVSDVLSIGRWAAAAGGVLEDTFSKLWITLL